MGPAPLRFFDFDSVSAGGTTLLEKAPDLLSLTFTLGEAWPGGPSDRAKCVRRVRLHHTRALFEVPCLHCGDGKYDLTAWVLDALARQCSRFEGEVRCSGLRAGGGCLCRLRFEAAATYRQRATPGRGRLSLCSAGEWLLSPGGGPPALARNEARSL